MKATHVNSENTTPEILVAAVGEVLWDVFPSGPRFGGAPANFACAVAGLAPSNFLVEMVSAVGKDALGADALKALKSQNVRTKSVARNKQETGQVHICLLYTSPSPRDLSTSRMPSSA